MNIELTNLTAIDCSESKLVSVAEFAMQSLGLHSDCELSISLVDEKEMSALASAGVRLKVIGHVAGFNAELQQRIRAAEVVTANNQAITLCVAANYGGQWDIVQATQQIAEKVKSGELNAASIDADTINEYLSTAGMPDPDLMIRTGGDHRISNFMLWQLAYAELYIFEDLFWPDFRKEHLNEAIIDFQMRERRFGKISEQLN